MSSRLSLLAPLAVAAAAAAQSARERVEAMDFGPFLTQTISSATLPGNTALKGVAVRLGDDRRPAGALFDTELLRFACLWDGGFLYLRGTPYDGSHGPHSRSAGTTWFDTEPLPGWAGADGEFADPRPIPGHGTLPRGLGRYHGLYRDGDGVVFHYQAHGGDVLDGIHTEELGGRRVMVRSLQLGACATPRTLALATGIQADGERYVGKALTAELRAVPPARRVTLVRTDGVADSLPWGGPRDGAAPREDDGLGERIAAGRWPATPGEEPPARPAVRAFTLGGAQPVARIHTYASGDDAVQRFSIHGCTAVDAPADLNDPAWTELAKIDTRRLGDRGCHGVAVADPSGKPLGQFHHLVLMPVADDDGRFTSLEFAAVDVLGSDRPVPLPKAIARAIGLRGGPPGSELRWVDGKVLMALPALRETTRLDLVFWRGDAEDLDAVDAAVAAHQPRGDLRRRLRGGPARWPETVTLAGSRGADDAAYTVDTVPVPFANPYGSWMRTGAFDFFSDGRAAVSTWNGDVWLVSGIDDDLQQVTWKRFATGLFDPLGLRIVDDVVYALGRDGITRLHDLNGDAEADYYEAFNHDVLITSAFHEFTFDLQTDPAGSFYFSKGGPVRPGGRGFDEILPHHGTILKVSKDGSDLRVYATGFRAPNGIGVGPDGQVTSGDNEGTWMPKCRLSWVAEGSFNGCVDLAHRDPPPTAYDKPLCWFPHDVDNSSGSQVWVTSDRWGPLQGELLHLSYGTCSLFKVMKETVNGQIQGGAVRLPLSFASSCMRGRFNPRDGQLYVLGLKGWQTSAAQDGCLQRVRYTGKPLYLPTGLHVRKDGVSITFTDPLDPDTANDPESYAVEVWDYLWGEQYGSPHLSPTHRDDDLKKMGGKIDINYRNSDVLAVTAARLDADGRTVHLTIDGIQPVMQMQIQVNLDAADGELVKHTIWNTIHELADR